MSEEMELQDKFIGFIDILGYSALTRATEEGTGFTFERLEALTKKLGTEEDRKHFEKYGATTCPSAPYIQRHMDFEISQAWDSVVVSAEVSPAGIINLISHCFGACIELLVEGVMCRGYVKRGRIHHKGMRVFGSGHIETVEMEKQVSFFKQDAEEKGTPFIEVHPEIVEYIKEQPNTCVKEMFKRMVLQHEGLAAIFPIQRLSHSFIVGGFGMPPFDGAKEKRNNDAMRKNLLRLKEKVRGLVVDGGASAVRKSEHYLQALDEQLKVCDRVDENIDALEKPFGKSYTKKDFPTL